MYTIRSGYVLFQNIYSMKKHVSYTCNSGELIQIDAENLRNKWIFILFPYCVVILLLGANFSTNVAN